MLYSDDSRLNDIFDLSGNITEVLYEDLYNLSSGLPKVRDCLDLGVYKSQLIKIDKVIQLIDKVLIIQNLVQDVLGEITSEEYKEKTGIES